LKWANYFRSQNISFLFWSAKNATAKLEGNAKLDLSVMDEGSSDKEVRILGREELLDTLESKAKFVSLARKEAHKVSMANSEMHSDMKGLHHEEDQKNVLTTNKQVVVGFVGYPNVGKSSTINALVGEKRTGVTSTPGKTKHFQTLLLSEGLMLCDCPGLVFPSFTSSRSEMVASGVLPIDRLTDHRGPVQAIAKVVPRHVFEDLYGFSLPKPKPYEPQDRPPTAYELLHAFCLSRGYVAGAGLADETRAARMMLKDYVNGKLLHYHLPPRDEEEESNSSGDDSDDEKDASTEDTDEALVYEGVMNHLDSFEAMAGMKAAATAPSNKMLKDVKAHKAHKMHKKPPRTKDRSWRVRNDDEDGMPLVRGVAKPVSYGAARLAQVKNG
jgi:large subunit GTPase 1